jgi:hypothetical protein
MKPLYASLGVVSVALGILFAVRTTAARQSLTLS